MMLKQGLFLISTDLKKKKKTFVNFFVQCYNYYKWYKTSIALGEKFVLNI